MEVTKLSTKGQIVIPESLRKDLLPGTSFNVIKKGGIIALKKIDGFTEDEIEEMKELDAIWKQIDSGKGTVQAKEEFLKEMEGW